MVADELVVQYVTKKPIWLALLYGVSRTCLTLEEKQCK